MLGNKKCVDVFECQEEASGKERQGVHWERALRDRAGRTHASASPLRHWGLLRLFLRREKSSAHYLPLPFSHPNCLGAEGRIPLNPSHRGNTSVEMETCSNICLPESAPDSRHPLKRTWIGCTHIWKESDPALLDTEEAEFIIVVISVTLTSELCLKLLLFWKPIFSIM